MSPATSPVAGAVAALVVAVPARDEAASVGACLRSIDAAAGAAGIATWIVLACDSCADGTADAALRLRLRHARLAVIEGRWGAAGAARAAAVGRGLASLDPHHGPHRVWIANTDADTVVPRDWLVEQLRLAERHDAVAGVVELDPHRTPARLLASFRSTCRLDGHRHTHVHGANLGVRASAYLDAGGWCPHTTVGEDHGLWNRLVERSSAVVQSTHVRVTTSDRVRSRVIGGFACELAALVARAEDAPDAAAALVAGETMGAEVA